MTKPDLQMSFLDHISELRKRLMWCLAFTFIGATIGYITYPYVLELLMAPILAVPDAELRVDSFLEGFFLRMKLSLMLGITYVIPFLGYHILAFILPALKIAEKKALFVILAAGLILFLAGFFYAYKGIIPVCVRALPEFSGTSQITVIEENHLPVTASLLLQFLLAFGVVFEIPLVLFVLMWFNILKRSTLIRFSRYSIVAAFIIAAILTPPDPLSQVMLALPLIALYFLAILLAHICKVGN